MYQTMPRTLHTLTQFNPRIDPITQKLHDDNTYKAKQSLDP